MSISLRLIIGSLVFALLAMGFAGYSYHSQRVSLDFVRRLTDDGVYPMVRLEAAKTAAGRLEAQLTATADADPAAAGEPLKRQDADHLLRTVDAIIADVQNVSNSAVSADVGRAAHAVVYPLSRMQASGGTLSRRMAARELADVSLGLDRATEMLSRDVEAARTDARSAAQAATERNLIGLGLILTALFGFALLLARNVGVSLRRVSGLAKQLAKGSTLEPIVPRGPREVRDVLSAMREMQLHCEKLESLMSSEVDVMTGRLGREQDRLAAALDNMSQALCMLDGQKRLVLCNEVFAERFGDHPPGTPARAFMADPRLALPLRQNETAVHLQEDENGQVMEVRRRGMAEKGLLVTFEDITERQLTAKRLEHMAGHDALTDLPNRRVFGERLDSLLARGRRGLAVAVLDIRSFKSINDTYGHPVGDAILKECGARLQSVCGAKATVARLGSNEFAIIRPGVKTAQEVDDLAESVLRSFDAAYEVEGRRIFVAGSIGALLVEPGARPAGLDADIALQNCDLALYQAKEVGGCAHRRFQPSMRERLQQRREMQLDLQTALNEHQFELYYQPFVDVASQRVSGFEALLRWHHPERGMISPSLFIPLAEETGLIEQLGKWALDNACRHAALWPGDLAVAVNLSAIQFKSTRLVEDVRRAVAESGLPPERLQIEVTESLFLDEGDTVLSILKEFRRMGLVISMDDFGTGYSSLGYLSRFPFDKIKIDQSFVRDLTRAENIAIVRSIIGLSRALRMEVIAEGIETAEQMQILYAEGCREMQGYLFSKPRPAGDLPKLLGEIDGRWSGDLGVIPDDEGEASRAA